ncbi:MULTISPECIES: DUF3011 domain-containing protein [Lysobacteraceae]|uniref:DUF3011 domain-containing protein n=1 Tax=Lysobacteraceae TaxID=32033 RepID=UPI001BCAEF81|nr:MULTISPECIES: DUF3011 domain-containing protein [Lysobacter]
MKIRLPAAFLVAAMCSSPCFAQQVIDCASSDATLAHCPIDASGGAFLQQQHSRAACVQGSTWGFDRNGIWVTGGCRATFLVGAPRHSRVAERNSAIAAAALLAGAFMWSARQRRSTDAPESAAPETFEQGCSAARASSGLPANASAAFRRGFAACKD